jgi:anti-sigma regulatory factor (Ser/Thr protein kinase)
VPAHRLRSGIVESASDAEPRAAFGADVGGRGLPLMRAMMDSVEVERAAEGTSLTLQRRLKLDEKTSVHQGAS